MKSLTPKRLMIGLVAIAACVAPSGRARAANLVQNGDFETGNFHGWFTNPSHNDPSLAVVFPGRGNTAGAGFVNNQLTNDVGISQTLPTIKNATYLVSFWLEYQGSPSGIFDASWAFGPLLHLVNPAPFTWKRYTYFVTAPFTTADIDFEASKVAGGFTLDDVYVSRIVAPEPSSWVLAGIGGAGLVGYGRRRRRAA